ncbi:auxin-responsive protein SAUR78 [Argentina anserina]|uniref:auxin-responsive protein SAUR78 n=1 Tax=Argentina anserina TaxID=57926 RepID=UPI0021761E08|nr:auxin-responsive protein SAUR78 [Potentilla anserina]
MKKINLLLRKCKSLSTQLGRSSSYSSLRSKSTREDLYDGNNIMHENHQQTTIFVGSTRKRYVISSKYMSHPLLNALIDKSSNKLCNNLGDDRDDENILVKCEVVLFDHLLWMLENGDPSFGGTSESLEELAALYVF